MIKTLNLKLKDSIEPSVLLKYGFKPKYDVDTGEIKEYIKKIHIEGSRPDEQYFSFILYTKHWSGILLHKLFYYDTWMSGFNWSNVCQKEALQLLFDLITDGIVEIAKTK